MAAKKESFYEVLGIDKNADEATIKKAYRKLSKKYHPDINKGNPNAERIFRKGNGSLYQSCWAILIRSVPLYGKQHSASTAYSSKLFFLFRIHRMSGLNRTARIPQFVP